MGEIWYEINIVRKVLNVGNKNGNHKFSTLITIISKSFFPKGVKLTNQNPTEVLPNNKISDTSKLICLCRHQSKCNSKAEIFFLLGKNIVRKGGNAGYSFSHNFFFKRLLPQGRYRSRSCGKEL